jgi:hypothetical protein
MKRLVLALYAEGTTDEQFLPPIIRRPTESILRQHEQHVANVTARVIPRTVSITKRDECILQAARHASSCDILIIHCDADAPTPEKALRERFHPGYELVKQTAEWVCRSLVPIIPIRMTEAWMLAADHVLLKRLIGTTMTTQDLGLVNKARQVESDPDPKQTLKRIIQRAHAERSSRHRDVDISPLYTALGNQMSLDRLNSVPSYQQFVADLTATLKILNLIQ